MTATRNTYAASNRGGFTLIEVMAALAILAVTVVPILVIRANNTAAIGNGVNERAVAMLAGRMLVRVLTDGAAVGWREVPTELGTALEADGDLSEWDRGDVKWEAAVEPEGINSLDPAVEEPIGTLCRITLTMSYQSGGQPRTFRIVTYRPQSTFKEISGAPPQP